MPFYFDYPSPYSNSLMTKEGGAVLWKKWRLLNGQELYNLSEDSLQMQDVINEHPEIATFMRQALDRHWSSIEAIANEPQRVVIGSVNENPTLLSACDSLGRESCRASVCPYVEISVVAVSLKTEIDDNS